MLERNSKAPLAFLSYAHRDDQQTAGKITELREALQLAVSSVVGDDFEIFQDSDAIAWGKQWQGRLDEALGQAQFLIPIITPSYFNSAPCRDELEKFVTLEQRASRSDLILPLYFRTIRDFNTSQDQLVKLISRRQYRDWREVRNKPLDAPEIREKIDQLAYELGESIASSSATVQAPARSAKPGAAAGPTAPALGPAFDAAQLEELRARLDKLEEERKERDATITALQSARTTLQEELKEARLESPSSTGTTSVLAPDIATQRDRSGARTHLLFAVSALAIGLAIGGVGVWVLPARNDETPPGGELDELKAKISELGRELETSQNAKAKLEEELRQRETELQSLNSRTADAEAKAAEWQDRLTAEVQAKEQLQKQLAEVLGQLKHRSFPRLDPASPGATASSAPG